MFAEERPALGPLPIEPFRYYRYGERTVHLDGCVEVEAAYYGAPPGWIGKRDGMERLNWSSHRCCKLELLTQSRQLLSLGKHTKMRMTKHGVQGFETRRLSECR